jgi:hypothetical protein
LPPVAVEYTWRSSNAGNLPGLRSFREQCPEGEDFVACADLEEAQTRRLGERTVRLVGLEGLLEALA